MYDVFENEIRLGDFVAFAFGGTHKMGTGKVIKINPKTVSVLHKHPATKWNPSTKVWEVVGTTEQQYIRAHENVAVYFADSR